MKTLGEVFTLSVRYLEEKRAARARFSVQEIFAHVLKIPKMQVYMEFERPMEERELAAIRNLLLKRATGVPLEYVLGAVHFFGCELEVNSDVLIPRQETEIMVDMVSKEIGQSHLSKLEVWDVCSGSGAIGLSLKKKWPQWNVTLSDVSEKAIQVAKRNADRNGVQVAFLQGDLLAPFQMRKADLVLCNPPYISKKEYIELDASVRDFEPYEALVGGDSGLEFYIQLAMQLPAHLNPRGRACLEIGSSQGGAVQEIFSSPIWRRKEVRKDWAGHDRFFFLELE